MILRSKKICKTDGILRENLKCISKVGAEHQKKLKAVLESHDDERWRLFTRQEIKYQENRSQKKYLRVNRVSASGHKKNKKNSIIFYLFCLFDFFY